MTFTCYGQEGFAALAPGWNDLVRRSTTNSIFLTHEWQTLWWQHLGQGDLFLVAVYDLHDHLVAIMPLFRTYSAEAGYELALVGCADVSDYLDLIVDRAQAADVYSGIASWLLSPAAPQWDRIDLCNLKAESLSCTLLPQIARTAGLSVAFEDLTICPVISLPDSFDAYLEGLDKKERHELRRKVRKAEREALISWQVVRRLEDDPTVMEIFFDLHARSSPEKRAFMTPQMRCFFEQVASTMSRTGWLELSYLKANDQPVATMLCFDYDNHILVYNSGYDPEAYPALAPGIVLLAYHISDAITRGRHLFDFMRGTEDYKFRLGGQPIPLHRLTLSR
ncbi:MAG: GNAT family N-acetyltransferase [Chloroflexi bacterium]|nr:GNAT family N-acetyltransferase [Chloroflexota bacterium]